MVQTPPPTIVTMAPATVQTADVCEVKLTGSPEVAVAEMVKGAAPNVKGGKGANEIVCKGPMDVTSEALAVAEPPPDTVARFVTTGGALAATLTVTVIGFVMLPEPMTSLRVQDGPAQVQPGPAMETSVRPAGRVSVTE